ncbi:MAG: hypothetical protein ACFE9D_03640 [Promethearchaeota archaeon]
MSDQSIVNYVTKLIRGLETRGIDFVVSEGALGCNVTEIFVTEAHELIIFPLDSLDTVSIQWILQVRTPLNIRITLFSSEVPKLKIQVCNAIKKLTQDGVEIPQTQQSLSIQDLTETNINRFLGSLENWANIKTNGRPLPDVKISKSLPESEEEYSSSNEQNREDLHVHLRNAIKTYWTERYFARYMSIPLQKVKELAEKIGIQREVCGHETLYFFNRKRALETYFAHIIKCILNELNLKYQETSMHDFSLPDLHLRIHFFEGEKEQLKILASEYVQNRDLIVITPESLRKAIGLIQDDIFQVMPLDQDKIKATLIKIVRQRIDYIPAYSSGIIQ